MLEDVHGDMFGNEEKIMAHKECLFLVRLAACLKNVLCEIYSIFIHVTDDV
jgi:hypothetical protein